MTTSDKGYKTSRWNDFWGWLNVRDSSDSIDEKQSTLANNITSEWNKLVTIPWYSEFIALNATIKNGQWIALYSWRIIALNNNILYVYDTATGTQYSQAAAVANDTDIYSIITTKAFSGNIAIVLINTNVDRIEDVKAYEFNTTTNVFTNKTITNLTNKNFKTWVFYEGKLILGWNPLYPSSLYSSKTWSVTTPDNIYDFGWGTAYDSSAQNVWDWEPIVWIVSNNNELFIFKTNSVWRVNGTKDTWSVFAYQLKQETASGALNPKCIVPVEQDILFFDWINIRRLSYEMNLSALTDDAISKEISPIIESLPDNQKVNATMYYVYPFVKLFLRDKFSSYNSVWIIYNIVDKSFSTQTWVEVIQWVWWFIDNRRTAYFISPQTSTVYQDNVWYTYNWWNIQVSHKSKRFVLWDWVDYKRISQVELYWETETWLATSIDVIVNWAVIDTREIYFAESITPTTWSSVVGSTLLWANWTEWESKMRTFVHRWEYFNDGRDFQFAIRSNWQWKFELHWLNLTYKPVRAYDLHY